MTLRTCWRYYIEPYSLCFIRLVLSPLVQFYRAFLPVKEGGLHYFSTTRPQRANLSSRLLYCLIRASPISAPPYSGHYLPMRPAGPYAFVCNGASCQKPCCTMGVLVVLRRATFTLFYPSPVVAIRPLLSVYSIRGALREHCAAVLTCQCELGNSTLIPWGL